MFFVPSSADDIFGQHFHMSACKRAFEYAACAVWGRAWQSCSPFCRAEQWDRLTHTAPTQILDWPPATQNLKESWSGQRLTACTDTQHATFDFSTISAALSWFQTVIPRHTCQHVLSSITRSQPGLKAHPCWGCVCQHFGYLTVTPGKCMSTELPPLCEKKGWHDESGEQKPSRTCLTDRCPCFT